MVNSKSLNYEILGGSQNLHFEYLTSTILVRAKFIYILVLRSATELWVHGAVLTGFLAFFRAAENYNSFLFMYGCHMFKSGSRHWDIPRFVNDSSDFDHVNLVTLPFLSRKGDKSSGVLWLLFIVIVSTIDVGRSSQVTGFEPVAKFSASWCT